MPERNEPVAQDVPEGFEELLRLLHSSRVDALREYKNIERKLLHLFEGRECSPAGWFVARTLKRAASEVRERQITDVWDFVSGAAIELATEAHSFDNLLQHFDPNRERAGLRYEEVRQRLIRFFERSHCRPAEEFADETLTRVAAKLGCGEVENIDGYITAFAKNIRREAARTLFPKDDSDLDLLPARRSGDEEQRQAQERRFECLEECIERLPDDKRQLFLEYFVWGEDPDAGVAKQRQTLAARLSLSTNALQVRAHRIKSAVQQCVRNCVGRKLADREKGRLG